MVVLTRSDDMEVSELSLGLAQRGVRLVRINRDDPAGRALGALRPDGIFHGQGEWLRTQAVWVRHFWDPGVRGDADRVHEAYVQEQLNALPGTLSEVGGAVVNAGSRITSRVAQVAAAGVAGFAVPPTVVTHDLSRAVAELGVGSGEDLVVKPLGSHWTSGGPGLLVGTFPVRVSVKEVCGRPLEPVPVIVQAYVAHESELRVFIVGGVLLAYRVSGKSNARSLWDDSEAVRVESVDLGECLAGRVRSFVAEHRVDLGAIDFLVQEDGTPVFLEINLVFDWRYFQKNAGDTRVSDALCEYFEGAVRA